MLLPAGARVEYPLSPSLPLPHSPPLPLVRSLGEWAGVRDPTDHRRSGMRRGQPPVDEGCFFKYPTTPRAAHPPVAMQAVNR